MEEKNKQNVPTGNLSPQELVIELKNMTGFLMREIQNLRVENLQTQKNIRDTEHVVKQSLKRLKENISEIRIDVSEADMKKLEAYKDYFKHYKPIFYISLFVILSGLGLSIFGAYSGVKWYRESVRTKQEIRQELLQEITQKGGAIISQEQLEIYEHQNKVLKSWNKEYPEKAEALVKYGERYDEKEKK